MTAEDFASEILGFEEVDYNEDEEIEEEEIWLWQKQKNI